MPKHTDTDTPALTCIYVQMPICIYTHIDKLAPINICIIVHQGTEMFIPGGTIKLSSKRKQHYSFILKLLLKKSIQVTWLCSRADIYSM